jgi:hypothetical protein
MNESVNGIVLGHVNEGLFNISFEMLGLMVVVFSIVIVIYILMKMREG